MLALSVCLQGVQSPVRLIAVLSLTPKGLLAQVLLQDVSLKRLMLAKRLAAGRVVATTVSLLALVDKAVAVQSLTGGKALSALLAHKFGCLEMGRVDMAVQVLLVGVSLVAAFVRALEGALAGVTAHVGLETSLTVEHLATQRIRARNGLQVRGALGAASGI